MTRREELIAYVEAYVNDEIAVQFETTMTATNELCYMFINATKEQTKEVLLNFFTEDLYGHMPNDPTHHQIVNWTFALRSP